MKEAELRSLSTCVGCRRKIGEGHLPLFWKVTVERFGLDLQGIRRQAGLEMMLGNVALAQVMGPNDDLAKPIGEPTVGSICEACFFSNPVLAALFESQVPA